MSDNNVTTIGAGAGSEGAAPVAIIDEEFLRDKIHMVRGQKVMLDFELAEIYGYTTTRFNQQVQRNIEKFEIDFMFQLTDSEYAVLMSQKVTSRWGGRRKPPYAFTEQGVYMLMTVFKGDLATKQSKALIRLFKRLKDFALEGRNLVGKGEFLELSSRVADSMERIDALDHKVGSIINGLSAPSTPESTSLSSARAVRCTTDTSRSISGLATSARFCAAPLPRTPVRARRQSSRPSAPAFSTSCSESCSPIRRWGSASQE